MYTRRGRCSCWRSTTNGRAARPTWVPCWRRPNWTCSAAEPYFAIVGTAHGSVGSTTVAFTCPDSYRITGALAAFAAQHVADMPAGVHPFWSIDEPRRALEFVTEAVPETEVSFVDDSEPSTLAPMIEEGSL